MRDLKVEAEATQISKLLAPGQFYKIPAYQRSYSWKDSDALGLLNDLLEAIAEERSHFLGAIVVVETPSSGVFEIVDGQQRLTTIAMLISLLRDLSDDSENRESLQALICEPDAHGTWRLTPNHVDAPYFRTLLQKSKWTSQQDIPAPLTESHDLLRSNYIALLQELRDLKPDLRNKLQTVLLDQCPIVRVHVENRDEGHKVFRVLNTRGRQPNAHDILKTELFERAKLSSEEADRLARNWTAHEARLGARDFDDLLRQIRLLHDRSPKGDLVSGFCQSVLSDVSPRDFLYRDLPRYVDAYQELKAGNILFSRPMPSVNAHLNRLSALEHNGWRAPALKFLVTHDREADTAREFFCDLERLAYAMQLIVSDRDVRAKRYRNVSDDMVDDYRLFSKSGALALTMDERTKLAQRLSGRFGSVGQRRALAMKVNALLDRGEDLLPDADATIEHILPRNPGPDSDWLQTWPDLAQRRELSDTLGNFCLLSKRDNQRADRLSYADKRQSIFRNPDMGGKFAITREASLYDHWTPDIVQKRTKKLARLLIMDWKLDLPRD